MKKIVQKILVCVATFGTISTHLHAENINQSKNKTFIVGAKIGLDHLDSLESSTYGYGFYTDINIVKLISIGASMDYWNSPTNALFEKNASVSNLSLGLNTKIKLMDTNKPLYPYILGGVAMHHFNFRHLNFNGDDSSLIDKLKQRYHDAKTEYGIDMGGGLTYRIQQSIDLNGEVRLRKLLKQNLDLDQLGFSVSLAYALD